MKWFILTDIRTSYRYLSGTSPANGNRVYDIIDYNKPGFLRFLLTGLKQTDSTIIVKWHSVVDLIKRGNLL